MFAIIRTGGKQYKVKAGDVITVEKFDVEKGGAVALDQVLMINDGKKSQVGTPAIKDASVHAVVLEHSKADKILVFKKKRRHNYRRKKGHRQLQTTLKIVGIFEKGTKPSKADLDKASAVKADKAEKKEAAPKAEKKPVEKKVAEKKATAPKKAAAPKKAEKKAEK